MQDKKFKFKLNEKVFILGQAGMCVITGRGTMEYTSNGKMNLYQLSGGCNQFINEGTLLTLDEAEELYAPIAK